MEGTLGTAYWEDDPNPHFTLNGETIYTGMVIEVSIGGGWIKGRVDLGSGGWYLNTPEIGITLRTGLLARRPVGDERR